VKAGRGSSSGKSIRVHPEDAGSIPVPGRPSRRSAEHDDPKLASIQDSKVAADIDGYGDEGAGYDLAVFARELESRGWRYEPQEDWAMSTDPRSFERAAEHEATRPHPLPSVRHTGKPVGRMLSDALGLTPAAEDDTRSRPARADDDGVDNPRHCPGLPGATATSDVLFFGWLSGFIDGEGCFVINRNTKRGVPTGHRCRFALRLRDDDRAVLDAIRECTGLGTVRDDGAYLDRNGQSVWEVSSKADCLSLCDLLDRYPLRAKKRADYGTWRAAVYAWQQVRGTNAANGNGAIQDELHRLKVELESGRQYISAEPTVPVSARGAQPSPPQVVPSAGDPCPRGCTTGFPRRVPELLVMNVDREVSCPTCWECFGIAP
jgi:hypothetical protein